MARIPTPELSELSSEQRTAVSDAEKMMGFVSNDALLMVKKPEISDAVGELVRAVYRPGEIVAGLKRLIGLMTSAGAGCQYCVGHTAFTSQQHGINDEKLAALWNFETSDLFSDAERAALRVAMHAGQTPSGVTDEMFAELGQYYSIEAQLEIVAVISLFGFLNRWNSTLATDIESLPQAALSKLGTQ